MSRGRASNEDEELEHTESEEGNNQDNPNFDGNDRIINKRKNNFGFNGDEGKSKTGKLLQVEDLEANKSGRRGGIDYDEIDRSEDSEGENLGGDVNF